MPIKCGKCQDFLLIPDRHICNIQSIPQTYTLDDVARDNNYHFPFFVKLYDKGSEHHGIVLQVTQHSTGKQFRIPELPDTLAQYQSNPSENRGWLPFYPEVQKETRTVYVNVYENGILDNMYKTEDAANRHAFPSRLKCIKLTYKVGHEYVVEREELKIN